MNVYPLKNKMDAVAATTKAQFNYFIKLTLLPLKFFFKRISDANFVNPNGIQIIQPGVGAQRLRWVSVRKFFQP
jgi:hypothetical protein